MAKLQEHFQMDYKKILPPVNSIIKGKKFRITILSELLVRLEYSETGEFEDRPTELVMSRKFPSVKFEAKDDNTYYLLLDEIQILDRFVNVLNSLLTHNYDIYVTGSNSRFLSKDVDTEFGGRGVSLAVVRISITVSMSVYKFSVCSQT